MPKDNDRKPTVLMEKLVDRMIRVLPAPSREEIARRMGLPLSTVGSVLTHLREYVEYYGWTVPHAARGKNGTGDDRFFAALVDSAGESYMEPEALTEVRKGSISTLSAIKSEARNHASALRIVAAYEPNAQRRRSLRGLAFDVAQVSAKAAMLQEEVQDVDDAGQRAAAG